MANKKADPYFGPKKKSTIKVDENIREIHLGNVFDIIEACRCPKCGSTDFAGNPNCSICKLD
jgi:hypothetical protein